MKVLVLNSGSSSVKFQLFDMSNESVLMKGMVDEIGLQNCKFVFNGQEQKAYFRNHEESIAHILSLIPRKDIDIIGHRVVHGGEKYKTATIITPEVIKTIKELFALAPLHNPPNLEGINACEKLLPNIPQVAVFDTAFHSNIPEVAYLYGVPYEYYKKYGIRKYGFHGSSHKFVMNETKSILKKDKINMISCHLGNGSSITAIKDDVSINTSMGFTPSQGLIMGTRAGDMDQSIVTFLEKRENLSPDQIDALLNKKSGLLGISGYSDMRIIHDKATKGDKMCNLAMDMLAYDIVLYIGAYMAIIGKVDAITFTGGIGENAYYLREKVINYLKCKNISLDVNKNQDCEQIISSISSEVKVLVIKTNEELMIAKDSLSALKK
ncbi:MAG: acetate/propionate family kinase [Candidatus Nanoarchaeia archaeon]